MKIFETVKQSVTSRQAAKAYGLEVDVHGMALCPFHDDHYPSLKLGERFYCFGCGASGDVIDFTARLFCLSLKDAAQKLAEDFGITPRPPTEVHIPKRHAEPCPDSERLCIRATPHNGARRFSERFWPKRKYGKCGNTGCISHFSYCTIGSKDPRKPAAPIVRCCPSVLRDYLRLLRIWRLRYEPAAPGEPMNDRFMESCQMEATINFFLDALIAGDPARRERVLEVLLKDGSIYELQAYGD